MIILPIPGLAAATGAALSVHAAGFGVEIHHLLAIRPPGPFGFAVPPAASAEAPPPERRAGQGASGQVALAEGLRAEYVAREGPTIWT